MVPGGGARPRALTAIDSRALHAAHSADSSAIARRSRAAVAMARSVAAGSRLWQRRSAPARKPSSAGALSSSYFTRHQPLGAAPRKTDGFHRPAARSRVSRRMPTKQGTPESSGTHCGLQLLPTERRRVVAAAAPAPPAGARRLPPGRPGPLGGAGLCVGGALMTEVGAGGAQPSFSLGNSRRLFPAAVFVSASSSSSNFGLLDLNHQGRWTLDVDTASLRRVPGGYPPDGSACPLHLCTAAGARKCIGGGLDRAAASTGGRRPTGRCSERSARAGSRGRAPALRQSYRRGGAVEPPCSGSLTAGEAPLSHRAPAALQMGRRCRAVVAQAALQMGRRC